MKIMNDDFFDNEDFKTLELEHFLFKLNEKKITNMHYLHGNCHLFALLYAEMTGAEIGCLVSESDQYSEFEQSYFPELFLDHAFCFHRPIFHQTAGVCRSFRKFK